MGKTRSGGGLVEAGARCCPSIHSRNSSPPTPPQNETNTHTFTECTLRAVQARACPGDAVAVKDFPALRDVWSSAGARPKLRWK